MIKTFTKWYCTLCKHSKWYDPKKEKPPTKCPACNDGKGSAYTLEKSEGEI